MTDQIRCAVVDCTERGRPQVCPYDTKYHHHGCIHYDRRHGDLVFHQGNWDWICDAHYAQLVAILEADRTAVVR